MTALEKLKQRYPDLPNYALYKITATQCPEEFGYDVPRYEKCPLDNGVWDNEKCCPKCWKQELADSKPIVENLTSFPKGVRLEPGYTVDKDGKMKILEVSIVSDEEKEKDMTGIKETRCTHCAHRLVCGLKEEYLNAQTAVERVNVSRDDDSFTPLNQIKWIRPVELDCIHFMSKPINVRGCDPDEIVG